MEEKVFYDEKVLTVGKYDVRIGYIPETKHFIAIRDRDPFFCFTGETIQEVKDKAEKALSFYEKYGLEERE